MASCDFERDRVKGLERGEFMYPFFEIYYRLVIEEEDIQNRLEGGEGTLSDDYTYKIYGREDAESLYEFVEVDFFSDGDFDD